MSQLPVVFLLGPTASGKTAVGMLLHQRLRCRLISVDSSLVYRGMDIGTAKPTPQELIDTPHALIDIREPWETYSAAHFVDDAWEQIHLARNAGQIPVLLGGTMLYFNALEKGLARMPAADPAIRDALTQRADQYGWEALHEELSRVDPKAGARIHPNDPQRIQRALEVWELTGKPISDFQTNDDPSLATADSSNLSGESLEDLAPLVKVALYPQDRSQLHTRIAARFQQMLDGGFLDEVRGLLKDSRITEQTPAMRAVGYRQALEYLSGIIGIDRFEEKSVVATRQLAKRQLTWMRSMDGLNCFDSLDETPESIVESIQGLVDAASLN